MKRLVYSLYVFFIVAAIISCKGKEVHSDKPHEEHSGEEIIFTPEQAAAVGLETVVVEPAPFMQVVKVGGKIDAAQGDAVTIVAPASGVVKFQGRTFNVGSEVKSGESIVTVLSSGLIDANQVEKAKAEYEAAHAALVRSESLVADSIISQKEYEQIKLRFQQAEAAFKGVERNVTADGVRVTSPISGYIQSLPVSEGNFVEAGTTLAVVSKNMRLKLIADLPERYFKFAKGVQSANFTPSYDTEVYNLSELNGKVISVGKGALSNSFYLPIVFEFDNTVNVLPGSFAEVYLLGETRQNVLSIPKSALTEEQGMYFVYLRLDEEGFKKQEVKLGGDNGARVEVVSGLVFGDEVVTRGAYNVKLAASSSVIPEGHTH